MMLLLFTARVDRRAECVARFVVPRFLTAVVVFLLFFFVRGVGGCHFISSVPRVSEQRAGTALVWRAAK